MHLRPGQKLTVYEIVGELGRGGMGEVYRARDTRLDREVAIKLLPPQLVSSDESLRRFEREAKLLAALNHPNVATIYDIDQVGDDSCFLALELVPGESLAELLRRGPLSVEAALGLADQVAAGLAAAHGRGIVHRDLKPANVMITPEGTVKLLDFGLAKVAEPDSVDAPPPESELLTRDGQVFGTPNYMSPEQIDGEEVRVTSDVWAFGCLLYEMLSGERAFGGPSLTAVLARVTTGEVDWSKLPDVTPPHVAELLRKCLRRDPAERIATIEEIRGVLRPAASAAPAVPPPSARRSLVPWAAPVLAALALVLFVLLRDEAGVAPAPTGPRTLDLPGLELSEDCRPLLSPDARLVVLRGMDGAGGLRVHDLVEGTTRSLSRTSAATHPFWSPDSATLGFRRDDALVALDLATDAERLLARLGGPWNARGGAAWLDDGAIVFTSGLDGEALFRIAPGGGTPEILLRPGQVTEVRHFHDPAPLPGGRVLLVTHRSGDAADSLGLVEDGAFRQLLRFGGDELRSPSWSDAGHVLFERASQEPDGEPGVWALPLASDGYEPAGDAFAVAPGAAPAGAGAGGRWLRASPQQGAGELVWIDREGRTRQAGVTARALRTPRLSRDGKRVALVADGPDGPELWVHDFDVGRARLLGAAPAGTVSWTPRDSQLAFADDGGRILLQDAFGAAKKQELIRGGIPELTADGLLLYADDEGDLWSLQLGASAPRRLTRTPQREGAPCLSADGRHLAYVVEESGISTVRVAPFPPGESSWSVSDGPAALPLWCPDRDELCFVRDGRLFTVSLRRGDAFDYDPPRELVPGSGLAFGRGYDYDAGQQSFLAVRAAPGAGRAPALALITGLEPAPRDR